MLPNAMLATSGLQLYYFDVTDLASTSLAGLSFASAVGDLLWPWIRGGVLVKGSVGMT